MLVPAVSAEDESMKCSSNCTTGCEELVKIGNRTLSLTKSDVISDRL